jgi:hypothetical protein
MPQIPIIMPQLGESIAEATIVNFLVSPGDAVEADDAGPVRLLALEAGHAQALPAPAAVPRVAAGSALDF